MVRRHFIWIAVFLVYSLPAKGTPECTSQCQNRSKVVECVGRNLTRVPSSNKCQRVFSLILDNNWIDLKTGDFASFGGLDDVLSLRRNRIKIISPYAFRNLSKLERLELNENNLTTLSRYAFEGLTSLKRLSLSENKLAVIERGIFEDLIGAEIFLLNGNVIQNIEVGSFTALRNLKQLELRSNCIEILLNHTFSGLSGLQELDLSNNIVRFMEFNAFRDLTSLNRLNLSRNRIVSVSAVHDLRLTVLDLSFNKVIKLNKDLNGRLTSQHQFAINVSNNSLLCDCDIEPLYDWYRSQSSPEGGIAQCAEPLSLHGTPLTEISMQDVCSTNMDATSQTLWTTAAANSNDAMAHPGLDEKTESSWTLPVMCVVLGLLGLVLTLVITSISYRKCKRFAPTVVRQMVPVETADATTDPSPIISQQTTPPETTPPIPPSRPPLLSGVPALPPTLNRSLPELPPEGHHWRSPNAPCLNHHQTASRHHTLGQRLSSHLCARDYITSVNGTNNPISSPVDIHIITTPCSPSAAGPSSSGLHRVPSLSNHTARHNYSNERVGVMDHLHGCQMRSATTLFPSPVSCSCTYISIHGTDSVTQTLRPLRKPREQASPKGPTQCDIMMTELAPDTPEYGLKLGRNGKVQIVSIEEIVQDRGSDDSWAGSTVTSPRPQSSALYTAV